MQGKKSFCLLACFAMLALCVSAWGQATSSLRGVVTDPTGAAVAGASVTITNTATNLARTTKTSAEGVYSFASVLPGTYNVAVQAQGFREYKQTGVQLMVNLPATSDVKLQVGSNSETVEVSGQAPLLNTTNATLGQTMGNQEIEKVPLRSENMNLLLSFQPGVVFIGETRLADASDTRSGSVNGERSDQNNITLDGVSNNDEFHGYAFDGILPTTQFSVQEFRVTTSNTDASASRSAGAQIALVTKSGTNHFHGNLYEFNRNTAGAANDYFLKSSEISAGQPNVPAKLVRNIFGGTLGGPIKKDRLFFFFNYEGRRTAQSVSAERTIPTATLRDGVVLYACQTASKCPGGTVTGVSGAAYPVAPGYYGLGPSQLKQMDPLGIGPSAVSTSYFKTYPLPNDFGVSDGLNFAGYRFAAPTREGFNWYIGRLDYKLTQNGNHTLFARGTFVDDRTGGAPFLPGSAPLTTTVDLSKGYVFGYTGVFGPRWVNSANFGVTRQSLGINGDSKQPFVSMRGLDQGITRTTAAVSPTYNILDTASYLHGSHNFQFGANILMSRRNSLSDATSYSSATTNADWVASSGFANQTDPLDPAYGCTTGGPCYPAVSSKFTNSYDFPLAAMMGMASEVDARYNYFITSTTGGTPLAQGAPIQRHWATDTYSFFFQDTWQVAHNFTLTYGLNYQLMTPITETAGQEFVPTVNIGDWFNQRWNNMVNGVGSNKDAIIAFGPAGSHWGRGGLYSTQTKNFAPRVGVAWKPESDSGILHKLLGNDATVVRAGLGMYYSNFGPELALTYDAVGSFGVSTTLQNPAGMLDIAAVPRITSIYSLPTTDNNGNNLLQPAPASNYPVTYPVGAEAIARGIDQSLKTPYSYAADLSIERTLPGNMVLDLGYVGHFAHRLLAYDDVANPTDFTDPKSGIDYFTAVDRLAQLSRQGVPDSAITASLIGPTAVYWQDIIAPQATYGVYSTRSNPATATPNMLAAVYDLFRISKYNETTGLYHMDLPAYSKYKIPQPITGTNTFYNSQFSSLYVWRSIAHSNYNALQVGLHRQMTHGLLFGYNYTYGHSLDVESMAERGARSNAQVIINPWAPSQLYGDSSFDIRHQMNGYWVAQLPFGKGGLVASNAGSALDAIIGGWRLSGTGRWSSGLPNSVFMGFVWPTNWEEMGQANLTGSPLTMKTTLNNGVPNVFADPTQAAAAFDYAYPGQSGMRNVVRGDGYMDWDMALAKSWKLPKLESQAVEFRWNVFNVTNSARFDINSAQLEYDTGAKSFGNYTQTLTQPRVMEFSLIYSF